MRIKPTISILLLFTLFFQNCRKSDDPKPVIPAAFSVPETEDIIMYEINIGSFSSQKNFSGITARLDEIKALGINVIWLMPIHPIGTLNSFGSPYCIKNFVGINPQLGNLDNLKELVKQAHDRKIAVILDWVANHTAWDHPWISEHPDWYTQNASGEIVSPPGMNWNDVADLNFNNFEMRAEMVKSMEYWIKEANIDGFRCDAADLIPFDFWKNTIITLKSNAGKKLILLAEGTRADHFEAGFQMDFSWNWYNSLKSVVANNGSVSQLYNTNNNEKSITSLGKRKLRFTTNHDLSNEQTPPAVFGSQQAALAAFVATLFMDGVPLIYSGQEVGVSQSTLFLNGQPINWNLNPEILAAYQKLLFVYRNSEPAKKGDIAYFNHQHIIAFEKSIGSNKLLILINSRNAAHSFPVPASLLGNWKNAMNGENFSLTNDLQLNAHQFLVLDRF